MFRIEVLNEMSQYVPAHWIHRNRLDIFSEVSEARKALRTFPSCARIVNVLTEEEVS